MSGRRLKTLKVSEDFFFGLLTNGLHAAGYTVISNAVPKDAKLVNVRLRWPTGIEMLIESEEFDAVEEGGDIPDLTPVLRTEEPQLPRMAYCLYNVGSCSAKRAEDNHSEECRKRWEEVGAGKA